MAIQNARPAVLVGGLVILVGATLAAGRAAFTAGDGAAVLVARGAADGRATLSDAPSGLNDLPEPTTVSSPTAVPTTAPSRTGSLILGTVSTTTAHSAATVPTATTPGPTATTTASTAPARRAPLDYGPLPPEVIRVPSAPGQSEWSATSNGTTLRLKIDPSDPKAGEPIRFVLEATTAVEPCCGLHIWFGDGYAFGKDMGWSCPGGGPAGPGTRRAETTHVYNGDGRFDFMMSAVTGNCAHASSGSGMVGSIVLAPGTTRSGQGPAQPTITVDYYHGTAPPEAPNLLLLWGSASDGDGHVRNFRIDWGDGSPAEEVGGDAMACRPSPVGWPFPSTANTLSGVPERVPPAHRYSHPGTYRATVTAFSTGCDGSDVQQVSGSVTFVSGPAI